MPTRTPPRDTRLADQADTHPSFVASITAVACAVTLLTLVLAAVTVGLVAVAEPAATAAALRDGFDYLWASLVETVWPR